MSALLDNSLNVTARHDHFFFDSPRIFFMHVHGYRTAAELAREAKPALDFISAGSPKHRSSVFYKITVGRTGQPTIYFPHYCRGFETALNQLGKGHAAPAGEK